jgi:hypothetical protein
MLLKQLKKINGTSQIMYDYVCRKLTLSYSEREAAHNSEWVVSGRWLHRVSLTSGFMGYLTYYDEHGVYLHVSMHN